MRKIPKNISSGELSDRPWIDLLFLFLYLCGGYFLFGVLAPFIIAHYYQIDVMQLGELMSRPEDFVNGKAALMAFQGITSFGLFIVAPLAFIIFSLRYPVKVLFKIPENPMTAVLLTVVILFCFMVANSLVIEWNQNVKLPDFMSDFESWALAKETQFEQLTEYLTSFTSVDQYLVSLFVIALIPAVGEELLFRGLLQNLFGIASKNPHLAIWFTAIMFGAFHMQFYGIVPRIFLGALFGYLYYWSGHLSLAMLGHFVNNGLTLTILYFSQIKFIDYDPTGSEDTPPLYVIAIFFVAGSVLLYLFRNLFSESKNA